jgi:hypothetical protein
VGGKGAWRLNPTMTESSSTLLHCQNCLSCFLGRRPLMRSMRRPEKNTICSSTMPLPSSENDVRYQVAEATLQEIRARSTGPREACVICLETITDAAAARPCEHQNFDYICLATWLHQDPRCPLCKAEVLTIKQLSTGDICKDFQPDPESVLPLPPTPPQQPSNENRLPWPLLRPRRVLQPYEDDGGSRYADLWRTDGALARREAVYIYRRYSKHIGSNPLSRYKELTPQLFCRDEELVSRARMWIRRELQIFGFLRNDAGTDSPARGFGGDNPKTVRRRARNTEFLLEYIIAILKSVDLMGSSGQAEDMLTDFLGRDNTRLFIHELRGWLRSPFTKLEDWDAAVQYDQGQVPSVESDRNGDGDYGDGAAGHSTTLQRNRTRYASDRYSNRYKRKREVDHYFPPRGDRPRQATGLWDSSWRREPGDNILAPIIPARASSWDGGGSGGDRSRGALNGST